MCCVLLQCSKRAIINSTNLPVTFVCSTFVYSQLGKATVISRSQNSQCTKEWLLHLMKIPDRNFTDKSRKMLIYIVHMMLLQSVDCSCSCHGMQLFVMSWWLHHHELASFSDSPSQQKVKMEGKSLVDSHVISRQNDVTMQKSWHEEVLFKAVTLLVNIL